LLQTYRGKYVAIHDEQVIDSDPIEMTLIERVLRRVGNVAIHVDLVTDEPRPTIRIPHYREIHRSGSAS
jgi:hypothetical protein